MLKNKDAVSPAISESQRQAIYIGLTSILTNMEANAALDKLPEYFSETSSVFNGVNSFARDICKTYDKDDQQRDLVRALNRALLKKDKIATGITKDGDRKTVPSASESTAKNAEMIDITVNAEEKSQPIEQPISTPEFQTFQALLLRIINIIDDHNEDVSIALHPFLNELIQSMPWSEVQQQQLLILIASGTTTQMRTYRPDQLKSFLKHLRSWLADEVGNKDADKLMNQASNEIASLPVSLKYSPKNFI